MDNTSGIFSLINPHPKFQNNDYLLPCEFFKYAKKIFKENNILWSDDFEVILQDLNYCIEKMRMVRLRNSDLKLSMFSLSKISDLDVKIELRDLCNLKMQDALDLFKEYIWIVHKDKIDEIHTDQFFIYIKWKASCLK